MQQIEDFLNKLYDETVKSHGPNCNEAWREELRVQFQRKLGVFEHSNEVPKVLVLEEEKDMGTYTRKRIEIETVGSLTMAIYVLIPKDINQEKMPAVLAIHGHGYGSREVVGLNPDDSIRQDEGYLKNFAISLVERGMVVYAPELIGFGDRRLKDDMEGDNPNASSCYMLASQLMLMGKTLAGLRVVECRRLIDYITTSTLVDNNRIGVMGISGGGLVTAFTSIIDERIKATVISGYTNTFKGSIMSIYHCLDNFIPGILQSTEMPDLIGLIAPRPLFIEAGRADPIFPIEHVEDALNQLQAIYQAYQVENKLAYHFFEGDHQISGEKSYEWLVKQLT